MDSTRIRHNREEALRRITSDITHDLRNPLNAIRLAAHSLRRRLTGAGVTCQDLLEIIEDQLRTCERKLINFQDMTRGRHPTLAWVDLKELLQEIRNHVVKRSETKCQLCLPAKAVRIMGDPGQLAFVLEAVLRNAVEATESAAPGGRGNVTADLFLEDNAATIAVQDDGPGVPESDREAIFEPLYTTKDNRTGMSLWIARRIAESHGGSLLLKASTPSGALFHVRLPLTVPGADVPPD